MYLVSCRGNGHRTALLAAQRSAALYLFFYYKLLTLAGRKGKVYEGEEKSIETFHSVWHLPEIVCFPKSFELNKYPWRMETWTIRSCPLVEVIIPRTLCHLISVNLNSHLFISDFMFYHIQSSDSVYCVHWKLDREFTDLGSIPGSATVLLWA